MQRYIETVFCCDNIFTFIPKLYGQQTKRWTETRDIVRFLSIAFKNLYSVYNNCQF